MELIDKAAVVAEIERRKEINKYRDTDDSLFEDEAILSFINTLEVKDVDSDSIQNCNSICKDLRDDGICNFVLTKSGRTMHCENISCSRKNKVQKGE